VNKIGFPKTERPGLSNLFLPSVICLWTCLLTWEQKNMKVLVLIFSAQYGPRINFQKVGQNLTSFGRG